MSAELPRREKVANEFSTRARSGSEISNQTGKTARFAGAGSVREGGGGEGVEAERRGEPA